MRAPKLSALFLTMVLAIGVAGAAQAADIGECGTPEVITAKLKAEGQHSLAAANRIESLGGQGKVISAMIFTTNDDRSVGYILKADKPLGDKASSICIYNRMANVRIFDARKPGVNPQTLLKATDADALRKCGELVRDKIVSPGSCGPLNDMIRRTEPIGDRVMLQAFNVKKQADGTYAPNGVLTTVSANLSVSSADFQDNVKKIVSGIRYSSLPEGATVLDSTLVYAQYTDYGLAFLE